MKTKLAYLFIVSLVLVFIGFSCKKEELPPYYAKGTIIAITDGCYGETILIEVDNPKGLGLSGTFSSTSSDINITYENTIGVPYFSKIGFTDSIPQKIGTWLYFEYRDLTEQEIEQPDLFSPNPPIMCQANIIPPTAKRLIITRIISYK